MADSGINGNTLATSGAAANQPSQCRAFAQKLRRSYQPTDNSFNGTSDFSNGRGSSMDTHHSNHVRKQPQQHAFAGQRYKTIHLPKTGGLSNALSTSSMIGNGLLSNNAPFSPFMRPLASSGYGCSSSNHESSITFFNNNQAYFDIVEPLDYEEYVRKLQQQQSGGSDNTSTKETARSGNTVILRQLLNFPADDLEVALERREKVFEDPKRVDTATLSKRELDFLNFYNGDWRCVRRRYYHRYASWNVRAQYRCRRDEPLRLVSKPQYEVDMQLQPADDNGNRSQEHCSSYDPAFTRLLERQTFEQRDAENCRRRLESRLPTLFTYYPLQEDYQEPVEKRALPQIPLPPVQHRLRIDCLQLRFDVEIEPIFASLALYDVAERRKVSENFYVDLNPPTFRAWLDRHVSRYDDATLARSALFSLTSPSPNLALVVRIEKVLQQGDISDAAEVYAKAASGAANDTDGSKAAGRVEKARQAARQCCERIGKYRMPFAWAVVFLNTVVLSPPNKQQQNDAFSQNSSSTAEVAEHNKGGSLDRNMNPIAVLRKGKTLAQPPPPQLAQQQNLSIADGSQTLSAIREENFDSISQQTTTSSIGSQDTRNTTITDPEEFEHAFDTFAPVMVSLNSFFRHEQEKLSDDDLLRYLVDLKKYGTNPPTGPLGKKLKTISATLQLCIGPGGVAPAQSPPPNCLSPELEKLMTTKSAADAAENVPVVREILELPLWRRDYAATSSAAIVSSPLMPPAHYILRNLLYIYPKSVNFSTTSRAGATSSARNLAVCVQLMRNEGEPPLPNVFGRSAGASVVQQACTYVLYHNKTPSWYDEIKIALPFNVDDDGIDEAASGTDNYHLFFTFYHVSCQAAVRTAKQQSGGPAVTAVDEPIETPVGYTWLPLMAITRPLLAPPPPPVPLPTVNGVGAAVGGAVVNNTNNNGAAPTPMLISGEYNLPIVMERPPPSYSSVPPDVNIPNMKWLDNHKGLFQLYVRPVSTVHTDEQRLEKFFHLCALAECDHVPHALANDGQFEAHLREAVLGVEHADVERLSCFLPLVLDKLLCLVVEPISVGGTTLNLASAGFQALAGVVREIVTTADDECNDQHGRNQQLLSFIYYQSTAGLLCRQQSRNDAGVLPSLSSIATELSLRESIRRRRTSATPLKPRSHSLHSSASVGDVGIAGGMLSSVTEPDSQSLTDAAIASNGAAFSGKPNSVASPRQVHAEFAFQWIMALSSSTSAAARDACFAHSWFFFEWLWQAMAYWLLNNGSSLSGKLVETNGREALRASVSTLSVSTASMPRAARYSSEFMENVGTLVREYSAEIIRKYEQQQRLAGHNLSTNISTSFHRSPLAMLNANLAFFLADCLSLCDRGIVFGWIYGHCKRMSSKILNTTDNSSLIWLKLDFLRILCVSHEHFVPLNLPSTLLIPITTTTNASPSPSITSALSLSSQQTTNSSGSSGGGGAQLDARNTELSTPYRQQHFLLGLVLAELRSVLLTPNPTNTSASFLHASNNNSTLNQHHAVRTVLTLLAWHDGDLRYSHVDARQRLALLYMPLINIVLDVVDQLSTGSGGEDEQKNTKLYYSSSPTAATATADMIDAGSSSMPSSSMVDPNVLHMIAHGTVIKRDHHHAENSNAAASQQHQKRAATRLSFETSRDLLLCTLWLLKCADQNMLQTWWETLSYGRLARLLDVLEKCLLCFEYRGRRHLRHRRGGAAQQHIKEVKSQLEDLIGGGASSARSNLIRRKRSDLSQMSVDPSSLVLSPNLIGHNNSGSDAAGFRWDKSRRRPVSWRAASNNAVNPLWTPPIDSNNNIVAASSDDAASLCESATSAEVSMIVLHAFELLVTQVISANDILHGLLRRALRVLLTGLACQQSVGVLECYFATCRAFIAKFPELLFEDETRYCAELCLKLLTHCSSGLVQVRALGASCLYLLMRQNYETTGFNNFARVKLQATIALNTLVGAMHDKFNDGNLKRALSAVLAYAQHDTELAQQHMGSFARQVHELVQNFHMILSDTVSMRFYRDDADMLLDLMFRIAKGYQRSPDLRLTWLKNMAQKHLERQCFAEAAMCYVHSAALTAEYLRVMLRQKSGCLPDNAPRSCAEFKSITANVLEETALSEALSVNPDREGICSADSFSPAGIILLMHHAAEYFHACGLYESMNAVYRMLLPMLESQCAYARIADIHERLHKSYLSLETRGARRLFATYFRIGFYGAPFSAMGLDGAEFVYKEPAITKLAEVAHRLEAFYQHRFAEQQHNVGGVQIIKDSSQVDRRKLDPNKAYIQVTYVEPFFYQFEMKKPDRVSPFQRNANLRRFAFSTPFTLDGRAHGELHEQYTKRTILTTSEAFPYIKTRIPVVKREETIQTPIELALEDLTKRTNELRAATTCEPADPKMLQMVLQGCIGVSVNVGPIRTAQVFLSTTTVAPTMMKSDAAADLAQDVMDGAAAALAGIVDAATFDGKPNNNNNISAGADSHSLGSTGSNSSRHDRLQHKLRLQFKEFSRWCCEAIKRNKALIGSDQREYQRELEKNYAHFINEVAPLLDADNPSIPKNVSIDFDYDDDNNEEIMDNGGEQQRRMRSAEANEDSEA